MKKINIKNEEIKYQHRIKRYKDLRESFFFRCEFCGNCFKLNELKVLYVCNKCKEYKGIIGISRSTYYRDY